MWPKIHKVCCQWGALTDMDGRNSYTFISTITKMILFSWYVLLILLFSIYLLHCKHFWLIKVNRTLINVNHKLGCWSMLFNLDQCCSILFKWCIWRACNKWMLINRCTLINVGWSIDADWGSLVICIIGSTLNYTDQLSSVWSTLINHRLTSINFD